MTATILLNVVAVLCLLGLVAAGVLMLGVAISENGDAPRRRLRRAFRSGRRRPTSGNLPRDDDPDGADRKGPT